MSRAWVIVAALVFVLVGCAPPVVGGTWHTGSVGFTGIVADDVTLDFINGDSVRATVVQGGAQACPERYTRSMSGRWFVNGAGEIVVSFPTTSSTCEVEHCDRSGGITRTFDVCLIFSSTVTPGRFVFRDDALASREQPIITLRRR